MNPFQEGDLVTFKDDEYGECWQVLEVAPTRCLVGDVGYETSNIIKQWVKADALEPFVDDEDDDDWEDED